MQVGREADPLAVDGREPPEQRRPVPTDPAEVRLVAAAVARQVRVAGQPASRVGQLSTVGSADPDLLAPLGQLPQPEEDVAAAVATRDPAGGADPQVDLAPGRPELLDELDARLPRPDDEHRPRRQVGVAPVPRANGGSGRARSGRRRSTARAGRGSRRWRRRPRARRAALRSSRARSRRPPPAGAARRPPRARPGRRSSRRTGHPPGDLVAGHVAVGVVAVVRRVGERGRPVRADQPEPVPAVLPAATEGGPPLEHDVIAAGPPQVPAHRQPGLAGADDDGVDPPRKLSSSSAS